MKHRTVSNAAWFGLATVCVLGCARSSHNDGAPGPAGSAGAATQGGSGGASTGGAAAGASGAQAGAASPGAGTGGSEPGGGQAGEGEEGGAGGTLGGGAGGSAASSGGAGAGTGGQGNAPSGEPGIVCGPWDNALPDLHCDAGEVCVLCEETDSNRSVRCAPNPREYPAEYAAFSAGCTNGLLSTECDGPEDCPEGSTCQLRADDDFIYPACTTESPSCSAYCVACNSSEDCPGGEACVPNGFGSGDWVGGTCGPEFSDLLVAGDWLIGWSGGMEHYSWYRFTQDGADQSKGTVRSRRSECLACGPYACQGIDGTDEETYEGTYAVVAGTEIHFELSASCAFAYRFTNLSVPPETGLVGSGGQARASARVVVAGLVSAQALLYDAGVGCETDFSACVFPAP
jgi:hypothetical protein